MAPRTAKAGKQEEIMKHRITIPSLAAAGIAGALALAFNVGPAAAQTATPQPTTTPAPTAVKKKPTSATPQMIDEAVQRSQARSAKANATGTPEQFGSEEPFTYVPGKTF
jgi:hypothetical protein